MSTNEEPYARYERLEKRANSIGWHVHEDPTGDLYKLERLDNPNIYRPAGREPSYAFTLDEVEKELDDLEGKSPTDYRP